MNIKWLLIIARTIKTIQNMHSCKLIMVYSKKTEIVKKGRMYNSHREER